MKRDTAADIASLRAYRLRRRPAEAETRPTRAEVTRDRQTRGDYRLRTHLLADGVPPTPEYKAARAALDAAVAATTDPEDPAP